MKPARYTASTALSSSQKYAEAVGATPSSRLSGPGSVPDLIGSDSPTGGVTRPLLPRGFSLLELLVVIVILALLASLVVPSIGNNEGRNLADAAERMMLLINQAQQEAVMSSRVWQVVFDPVEDHFYFRQQAGSDLEDVTLEPFAGKHSAAAVDLDKLEINGRPVTSSKGEVFLFPTAEQDHFRLILRAGDTEYVIAMGPVGLARVVK